MPRVAKVTMHSTAKTASSELPPVTGPRGVSGLSMERTSWVDFHNNYSMDFHENQYKLSAIHRTGEAARSGGGRGFYRNKYEREELHMAKIKYHASAHFDIETEVNVTSMDEESIRAAILADLESRYGLEIEIVND